MKAMLTHPITIAIATAFLMWVGGWVRQFLAKRVKLSGPLAKEMERQGKVLCETVKAVNILVDIKGPELRMFVALGEAMQGKNNGNVTDAMSVLKKKGELFQGFKDEAAKIDAKGVEVGSA